MLDVPRRWWRSATGRVTGRGDDTDPKEQLELAIAEADHQHRRLKEQATNVIANQMQAEIRLNTKLTELERLNVSVRQALIIANDATIADDGVTAAEYEHAAEVIAGKLITVEADVDTLKRTVLESTQATDQAKTALTTNSRLLQEKLSEKSKQLSQLEQAKMQEEINAIMAQLSETVGDDVPSFEEVQDKIDARYARATAPAELSTDTLESRMRQIEQVTENAAAQERVDELRAELGFSSSPAT